MKRASYVQLEKGQSDNCESAKQQKACDLLLNPDLAAPAYSSGLYGQGRYPSWGVRIFPLAAGKAR
jgi:hypothetical protein